MAGAKCWIVGKMVNGSFIMSCDSTSELTNYYMFDSEVKAWSFITTKIVEEDRDSFTVQAVNVIRALR